MFQFPSFPLYGYVLAIQWQRFALPGFPIRISTGQSLFAAHRSFSQLITSFIGSRCQGIHSTLLVAWPIMQTQWFAVFCALLKIKVNFNFTKNIYRLIVDFTPRQFKYVSNAFKLCRYGASWIINLLKSIICSICFSKYKMEIIRFPSRPKWTRTTDLTLIRRAL